MHPQYLHPKWFSCRDGFPFFYDAIKWVYQTKNWGDEYKYLLLKGLEGPSYKPVNVSVTVLFSPEVFYGAGLNNRYLVQMIAGYAIQVHILKIL